MRIRAAVVGLLLFPLSALAQPKGFNYDEAKVPRYAPLDPLAKADGSRIANAKEWESRRQEILKLVTREMFGSTPAAPRFFRAVVIDEDRKALNGTAIRKQVLIVYGPNERKTSQFEMLVWLPANAKKPTPLFVGLNFRGNHATSTDPAVHITPSWMRKGDGVVDDHATEQGRGIAASRWPASDVIKRGYGLATIYYGDIDPDFDDGFQNGVHGLYGKKGQDKPAAHEWGSIAAWAWGLSRAMDYFETDDEIDEKHIAVVGHSRLGKTSIWAGATDPRFAIVISNNSGCGGAALSKRRFGETVARINTSFPHWFNDHFLKYNDNEQDLPFDQHFVLSLIAPRPLYVASATGDRWADPKGEFLAAKLASPVYELLTGEGLPAESQPPADTPVQGRIGYHLRSGKHDITGYDWTQYMNFADKHWNSGS